MTNILSIVPVVIGLHITSINVGTSVNTLTISTNSVQTIPTILAKNNLTDPMWVEVTQDVSLQTNQWKAVCIKGSARFFIAVDFNDPMRRHPCYFVPFSIPSTP